MTTSRTLVIALALVAGCKKSDKPADPTAGSGSATTGSATATATPTGSGSASGSGSAMGSGSGSAAPVAAVDPKACFNQNQGEVASFAADDKTATACIKLGTEDAAKTMCLAADLATGKWSAASGTPPSAAKPAVTAKLDLPKLEDSAQYELDTSADGKLVATTAKIGTKSSVVLLDAATGKRAKTWPLGDSSGECLESAHFVGDNVFVITSVCAGPGGTGYVFDRAGKQLAKWEGTTNVYGAQPLHLDGDRWLVAEFGGYGFAVLDARTGKQTGDFTLDSSTGDCPTCMSAVGPAFADNDFAVAGGKIIMLSQLGIDVVDPATLKSTKHVGFPLCLANTAAPPQ